MIKIISYFFIVFCIDVNAQTKPLKIKVKKETYNKNMKQSEMPHIVTLCDKYTGDVTKSDIIKNPVLKISNNIYELQILSFELIYKKKGKLCLYSGIFKDTIPNYVIKEILEIDKQSKFFISTIKATTKQNDTLLLNAIELRVVD